MEASRWPVTRGMVGPALSGSSPITARLFCTRPVPDSLSAEYRYLRHGNVRDSVLRTLARLGW